MRVAIALVASLLFLGQRASTEAVSADVKWTVAAEEAGLRRYTYVITNTSTSVAIAAFELEGNFSGGTSRMPDWPASLVGVEKLVRRAMLPSAWLAPGQSLSEIYITSRALPGVGSVRVFPALMPAWDEPPVAGARYHAVCPVIGSLHRQPLRAAEDILGQLRDNLVAAIRADADPSGSDIDRLLEEARVALEGEDLIRASESLRAAAAMRSSSTSQWRQALHDSLDVDLAYLLALINRSTDLDPSERTVGARSVDLDELSWDYPGVAPPPLDLELFIRRHAFVFVGAVEEARFEDNGSVGARTRVRLRPTEVFRRPSQLSPTETIDVWLRGGIYQRSRRTGSRWPAQPADAALGLQAGDSVFVAAAMFDKQGSPLNGQLWIDVPEAFVRLTGSKVQPGPTYNAAWIDTVLARSAVPAVADRQVSQVELFLSAVRAAAQRVGHR